MIPPSSSLQKRSLENPNIPITGASVDGYVSNKTVTGQHVTPESSWTYSAVYAAIRLLAETVAQLPLHLYRREGNRRVLATEHPCYSLVHDEPHHRHSSFSWREMQMSQTLSYGNGYAMISRARDASSVVSIQPLNAASTFVHKRPDDSIEYYSTFGGKQYQIQPRDILHVPAMGYDGISGVSPITAHRQTIALSMSATEFGGQFFGNGVTMSGVVSHPKGLGVEAKRRIKDGWERLSGTGYNGVVVLDEGMEYQRIGIPPDDAQFLETRQFQVSEIARIYNIPNHMLRDLEKSSFNNISEQSIEFLRYTMMPWLVKWEQELNRKLLLPSEREQYYFKFSAAGLLRGTQTERFEAYGRGILDGWLSRNEVREWEELNPVEGLDEHLQPLNMVPISQIEEQQAPANDEAEPEAEADTEVDPEEGAERDFAPLIEVAAQSFTSWLADVDHRAKDTDDRTKRLAKKLGAMSERYIYPIFAAAGVEGRSNWVRWLSSWAIDENLPDKSAVTAAINDVLGANNGH